MTEAQNIGSKSEQAQRDRAALNMSPEEFEAWETLAEALGMILRLPTQHPMEKEEVAHAGHQLQNYLLGRFSYRRYLAVNGEEHV